MNIKKLWMPVFALLLSSTVISAQEQRIKEEGKTEFKPHWFMQVQVGAAHTLGEAKFSDLISPAAAINVGYQFAPAWRAAGTCWCQRMAGKRRLGFSATGLPVQIFAR